MNQSDSSPDPVEIRGIKIGEVVKVELEYDTNTHDFRVPVLVMIDRQQQGGKPGQANG